MIVKRCDGATAQAKTEASNDPLHAAYWNGKVAAYEDIRSLAQMALDTIGMEQPS